MTSLVLLWSNEPEPYRRALAEAGLEARVTATGRGR